MFDKLLTIFTSVDVIGNIAVKLEMFSDLVDGYLSGIDNLRMASIILMILALLMFLFLIIIIYIKTIIAFLRNEPAVDQSLGEDDDEDIFDEEDQQRLNKIIEEQERDRELEKELQKELDMARAEREAAEKNKAREQSRLAEAEKKKKAQEQKTEKERSRKSIEREPAIDLDWKKGQTHDLDLQAQNLKMAPDILSYHQSNRPLSELMGLIIDMLGRGVDDLKIAQTVMFRNHNMSSEEDVLQIIESIKSFAQICRNQSFAKLPNRDGLPSEEEAIFHLAEGDPTLALALVESLMDYNIERASAPGLESKKDSLFQEVSNQALLFGNLAAVNDVMLATGSFELAIELQPRNVSAWSRLAGMYAKTESTGKAIWAYQNVLNLADGEINAREVANASKNLSQHLYAQGNSLQAAKLYNSSKQYYDALGINRRLDKQEIEIVEVIEANHQDELPSIIMRLLGRDNGQGFSFG